MSILDAYTDAYPTIDNALDIFKGEWSSHLPGFEKSGTAALFEDPRLLSIIDKCGGLSGKKCLELGPLEGGHTYVMSLSGARSILSIEGNQRAFLKCLISKELLKYRADFLFGDFTKFVAQTSEQFDFTNMSVLYHMVEPVELIRNVARISEQVACWTHYFDHHLLKSNRDQRHKFDFKPTLVKGTEIKMYRQKYLRSLKQRGFCGGRDKHSYWLEKPTILSLFNDLGFTTEVLSDVPDHPYGPSMNFYATRRRS